ncbi:D-erythronate dehydrogenase [Tateyamaria sp. ANG-S1]|uniref:D-erythronate dehydrogenase n=1 Tax=Tateyamaria sp. ANG-S1 TaxID=1577905 RepID=UPI00057DF98E|nr:D-erythronate dehydrogenase [Tateyamaria sp. ANG-S1]KIC48041.1 hypothetical protein RA29_17765 [Tateyamaria sp. ANG-S1]
MRVAITGSAGFLGGLLVERFASAGEVSVDGQFRPVDEILACDVVEAPLARLAAQHPVVRPILGEIGQRDVLAEVVSAKPDLIVHLAAVVSSAAEEDLGLGLRVNVDATMALIQSLEAHPIPPVFIFASSVAVFACDSNEVIHETQQPAPRSSYGAQKLIGEILVRDASRRGIIRGRSLRVPTISVRPGRPNRAASSFASGIIREPMTGEAADLPVGRDVRLHLASPAQAIDNVLHAIGLQQGALDGETTITLPGLSVSVDNMLKTLRAEEGDVVADRVRHVPDAAIEAIVKTWPGGIETPRAERLGFAKDHSFRDLLDQFRQTLSTPV